MRAWEIQKRKAQKRRREADRRERRREAAQNNAFKLIFRDAAGKETETMTHSVIVKNSDESVYDAGFEEVEAGMTLVVEGHMGLIERAVIEEKVEPLEEGGIRILRTRRAATSS